MRRYSLSVKMVEDENHQEVPQADMTPSNDGKWALCSDVQALLRGVIELGEDEFQHSYDAVEDMIAMCKVHLGEDL